MLGKNKRDSKSLKNLKEIFSKYATTSMSFNCNAFLNFDVFYKFNRLCVLSFYAIFYLFKSETNHKTSQN